MYLFWSDGFAADDVKAERLGQLSGRGVVVFFAMLNTHTFTKLDSPITVHCKAVSSQ